MKIRKEHIREQWDEGHPDDGGDGYWIALVAGWKSADDPIGNLHVIHEDTRRDALEVGVMRCDCRDCKQP
jgi:hypothetical protein